MSLVDTCVLIDVSADDPDWREWSVAQLAAWSVRGPLLANPAIFAERCSDFASLQSARSTLAAFGLRWAEMLHAALYLACHAHLLYRRRGGTRAMVSPELLIGTHAAVEGWPVPTRDRRRLDAYFSGLEIASPV